MIRLTIRHLKNRFFVQSQDERVFQSHKTRQYFSGLKHRPNTGFGPKDGFESAFAYVAAAILIILFVSLSGCGIKGPPVPPKYATPPAVSDLQYQVNGERLSLTWSIPSIRPGGKPGIAGVKVFRLKESLKNLPCKDCPRAFTLMSKIPARSGTMQFQDIMDKGFGYYYKVVLYDAENRDGKDSNIVHFEN
jgi:predicted small lipoprotein YifL